MHFVLCSKTEVDLVLSADASVFCFNSLKNMHMHTHKHKTIKHSAQYNINYPTTSFQVGILKQLKFA